MSTRKKKATTITNVVTLAEVLAEIRDAATVVKRDVSRCIGVLDKTGTDLEDKVTYHKLQSVSGRVRFATRSGVRYVTALATLKRLLTAAR